MTTREYTSAGLLNGWRIAGWGAAAALLALPAIAMLFTGEVNWGPGDFVVMGAMLLTLGLGIELTIACARTLGMRLVIAGVLVLCFLTVWAELAVGIFD